MPREQIYRLTSSFNRNTTAKQNAIAAKIAKAVLTNPVENHQKLHLSTSTTQIVVTKLETRRDVALSLLYPHFKICLTTRQLIYSLKTKAVNFRTSRTSAATARARSPRRASCARTRPPTATSRNAPPGPPPHTPPVTALAVSYMENFNVFDLACLIKDEIKLLDTFRRRPMQKLHLKIFQINMVHVFNVCLGILYCLHNRFR